MRFLRATLLLALFCLSANSFAWWGGAPYAPAYPGGGYWPNYSPGGWQGYGPYGQNFGYGGSDWNVKGTMNEWGDAHFVIEYHGNVYDDMTGSGWGRSNRFPGGFPGYGGYGLPYGGWR